MKDDLDLGTFTELTETEAELVGGGSIFSNVLDIIRNGLNTTFAPPYYLVVGTAIRNIADYLLTSIETIAAPIYGVVGLKFRG